MKKNVKKTKKMILSAINALLFKIVNITFSLFFQLRKNKVLFLSDVREVLDGNLKFLYDRVPEDVYEKIVSLKRDRRVRRSLSEKIKLVYNISTAKYIILEDLSKSITFMRPRKNQEICQLWHGAGAFKRFGHANLESLKNKTKIHPGYKKYTKAIVSSPKIRKCYADAFNISITKVRATGIPRTDIFFNKEEIKRVSEELYNKYNFPRDKKIILFAPTYRGIAYKTESYDFSQLNLEMLYKELSNDYIFIFKWHPSMYSKIIKNEEYISKINKYNNFFYDFTDYRDINDLLFITDVLITDYSSVIFDYVLLDKPIVYFTYDLDEYLQEKGLFYPFSDYVYGEVAKNINQLIKKIKLEKKFPIKRKKFIEKFMSSCDGKSTEKVYKWIFEDK